MHSPLLLLCTRRYCSGYFEFIVRSGHPCQGFDRMHQDWTDQMDLFWVDSHINPCIPNPASRIPLPASLMDLFLAASANQSMHSRLWTEV